jgi:hypothetical protein
VLAGAVTADVANSATSTPGLARNTYISEQVNGTDIYPTGGQQAIDWAVQILINHVNPPHKIEFTFQEVRPDNAHEICDPYHCPQSLPMT